jgi:hypothetical protein
LDELALHAPERLLFMTEAELKALKSIGQVRRKEVDWYRAKYGKKCQLAVSQPQCHGSPVDEGCETQADRALFRGSPLSAACFPTERHPFPSTFRSTNPNMLDWSWGVPNS